MRTHPKKLFFCLIVMLMLLPTLITDNLAQAADNRVYVVLSLDRPSVVVGKTFLLNISISNTLFINPVRITKVQCGSDGTLVRGTAISHLPSILAVNQTFQTQQMYRAYAPGIAQVSCEVQGVDTVTGETITGTNDSRGLSVIDEKRLYFDATTATRVARVREDIYIQTKFGNRGKTLFTMVHLDCLRDGRGQNIFFISHTEIPGVLLPGQSTFVEFRLQGILPGDATIICTLSAIDTTTGNYVILSGPYINLTVR